MSLNQIKKALIPLLLAAIISCFFDRRVSFGILLGYSGAMIYNSLLHLSFYRTEKRALLKLLRLFVLTLTLLLAFIFPKCFNYLADFAALFYYRICIFYFGRKGGI